MSDRAYGLFSGVLGFAAVVAGLNIGTWVHGSMSGTWAGPVSVAACGVVVLAIVLVGHVVTGQMGRLHLHRAR